MGLNDRISRATKETQGAQSCFISLRSIYIFLHNQYPHASNQDIFSSFCLECNLLNKIPTFYEIVAGRPLPVNSNMITAFQSGFTSFEESGRNLLPDLSSVVRTIEPDPMMHPDAEIYGFIREEISTALGIDFPANPEVLRDYEAEINVLQKQLMEAQERITALEDVCRAHDDVSKGKNIANAERFSKNREDVLSALISIICHPEYFLNVDDTRKLKEFGLEHDQLVQLFKRALPSQQKWVKTMDEKSYLFWPEKGEAPLSERNCQKLLSEAINRLS